MRSDMGVSPRAVHPLTEFVRLTLEVGHHEARVSALGSLLVAAMTRRARRHVRTP